MKFLRQFVHDVWIMTFYLIGQLGHDNLIMAIEQDVLDTNAEKQLSYTATDV